MSASASTQTTSTSAASAATATPNAASAQIFIDPTTGEARAPNAAELARGTNRSVQSASASSQARAPVTVTPLPNGVTEYDFGGPVVVEDIACLRADGAFGACTPAQLQELRAMQQSP